MTIKNVTSNVSSNIIGAGIGAVALYFGAKKFMKVENKWALGALVLTGVIAGAMVQSKLKSKATIAPAIAATK